MKIARIAVVVAGVAVALNGAEGFGTFRKVVAMERLSPPQRVLPVKHIAIVFDDNTHRAAQLRQRVETVIRESDPAMRIAADAPFTVTVHLREFLREKTRSIEGEFTVTDRAARTLYEGYVSASNAGALVNASDDQLVDDAAKDVARILVATHHRTAVLIPKGGLDALVPLAERGEWPAYLAGIENQRELRGDGEAYRQYALGVGQEAAGYASKDATARLRHLREAVERNIAASRLKPSEKLFAESYSPMSRAFSSPGLPPRVWIDPHAMELWESVSLIDSWMNGAPAANGALDNRALLDLMIAGRSDQAIITAIAAAKHATFALGQPEMAALSKAGVSWPVIDAMRAKVGLPRREFHVTPDSW